MSTIKFWKWVKYGSKLSLTKQNLTLTPRRLLIILRSTLLPSPASSPHWFPYTKFTCWMSSSGTKSTSNDNRNILRRKSDNILFTKTPGKLQTGLTCHHKFNTDTLHFITTGIEKNFDNFVQDVERVVRKFSATFSVMSSAKPSKSRKRKESSAKANRSKIHAAEARKKRACFIFLFLGAHQLTTSMSH